MMFIIKYFLDLYIQIVEYAETQGVLVKKDDDIDEYFHVFLSLSLGFFFGLVTIAIVIAELLLDAFLSTSAAFVFAWMVTGLVSIVFFILMFLKIVEIYDWMD